LILTRHQLESWILAGPIGLSVSGAVVRGAVLDRLQPRDGPVYPFRRPLYVRYVPHPAGFQVQSPELQAVPGLHGEGETEDAARLQLARNLHRLVEQHFRVPPHLQSDADRAVAQLLGELIDWERFNELHPVEQALWGQVVEQRPDGSLLVHWFLGPRDMRDQEGTLAPEEVHLRLVALKPGEWFYGSAKVYPEHIRWVRKPTGAPDPRDRRAVQQAWDRIPRTLVNEVAPWPRPASE
jgi:hypothetical protein